LLRRDEIEAHLAIALETKREAWNRARTGFSDIISQVPSGLPHPDGSLRLKTAGEVMRFRAAEFMDALQEFNAFVIHGIVPARFQEH
jgi:hypothetical protein